MSLLAPGNWVYARMFLALPYLYLQRRLHSEVLWGYRLQCMHLKEHIVATGRERCHCKSKLLFSAVAARLSLRRMDGGSQAKWHGCLPVLTLGGT